MSIPYDAMHAAAAPYMPEGTIKPNTTWIAIMLHSITSLKQIKDRNDFLWLKCHPRITLKTLKHEYFTRHPLEEFELKFNHKFPPETLQVGVMAGKHNPIQGSRIVILRAFEEEAMEGEGEIEQDTQKAEGIREKYNGRGATSADAIDLDEDPSDAEEDTPTSTPSKKRKHGEMAKGDDQSAMSYDMEDSDIEVLEGQNMSRGVEEAGSALIFLPDQDWNPLMSRVQSLPEEFQAKFNESPWSYCETCGKDMLTKPWTRFGPGNGTLCTLCTMQQLADAGDKKEIASLEALCAEELAEKQNRSSIGVAQNMDADAPLDWAKELGNIHDTLQEDQAKIEYEPSDELLDEKDAANAQLQAELGHSMTNSSEPSGERLNHFERGQPANDSMTNGTQGYRAATTVEAPPTPPSSDLELNDNGEMDTSVDGDDTNTSVHRDVAHMSVERNSGARAESPILCGDMEDEATAAEAHVDSASEASFQTAKDETALNDSVGGSGETVMREDEPDRRQDVDQWLAKAHNGGDEEDEE